MEAYYITMKAFEELGLTKVESEVYFAILELGSCLAGQITTKTGIHRRTVYDVIERLIQKGLVNYIITNNRKYFEAVNPERLNEMIEEKKEALNSEMPVLKQMFEFSRDKKETVFYKGKQAMKGVFNDQIGVGKEILIFGASTNADGGLKYYFPHVNKERVKKKIKVKIIFDEHARGKVKIPLSEIRYLPKEYGSPAATNIYGDKVAIILWSDHPIGILIKNADIAESYKRFFELMWKSAKK